MNNPNHPFYGVHQMNPMSMMRPKKSKPHRQLYQDDDNMMMMRQLSEEIMEKPFPDTHKAKDLSQKTF